MVTIDNGNSVILLGCYEDRESIYKMKASAADGSLIWEKLPQKLQFPRTETVAMLVPDTLVKCNLH